MVVQHTRTLEQIALKNAWLTIGSFDGVHLGHQAIVQKLTAGAHQEGAPAVVLTFDPHPKIVLRPDQQLQFLTSPDEKADRLVSLGVDLVVTHPFNHEVAALSARDFLARLNKHLDMRQFWVGHDFAMGRNREGDITTLRQIGIEMGFTLQVVSPVDQDGQVVSSSIIRNLLRSGQVDKANQLLGYDYRLTGEVIHGAHRGRVIGIPTANLAIPNNRVLPANGVYACRTSINGLNWNAVTNVGIRPTFENGPPALSVEAHILDFSGEVYGQVLNLDFVHFLRGEQRFSGVSALREQIDKDIAQARDLL